MKKSSIIAAALLLASVAAVADEAQQWKLGAHLISVHVQKNDDGEKLRTLTPGLYAIHRTGITLGVYSNSEGGASAYGGWTYTRDRFQITLGLVTGYKDHKVLPLLAPSVRLWDTGFRLSFIAGMSPSIHLSKEF